MQTMIAGAPQTIAATAVSTSTRVRRIAAFSTTAAVVSYYAINGGSYDIVTRQIEATAVWWIVALCSLLGLIRRPAGAARWRVPVAALACLAVWTFASLLWTSSDERTLAEAARVVHYAGVLVLIWGLLDRDTWTAAAAGLFSAAVLVVVIAVASRLFPGLFPGGPVAGIFGNHRLDYPLNYWNGVAAWASMSAASGLAWSGHAKQRTIRMICLASVPLSLSAVYLTYSRSGAAIVLVGVAVVLACSRHRWVVAAYAIAAGAGTLLVVLVIRVERQIAEGTGGEGASAVLLALLIAGLICAATVSATSAADGDPRWRMSRRLGRRSLAVCVTTLLVAAAIFVPSGLAQLRETFLDPTTPGRTLDPAIGVTNLYHARSGLWRSAIDGFGRSPVLGAGAGTSEFRIAADGYIGADRDTHSLYLEQLAELGVPGLAMTIMFLGGLLLLVLRRRRILTPAEMGPYAAAVGAFSVFVAHAAVDWMWELTAVTVFAVAGMAIAASAGTDSSQRVALSTPAKTALIAVALAACLLQLPGAVSNILVRDSHAAARNGSTDAAVSAADRSARSAPWAAGPYAQRALLAESAGDLTTARRQILHAIDRERLNFRYFLLLARIEAERGRVPQALAAYQRARELRPASPFVAPR